VPDVEAEFWGEGREEGEVCCHDEDEMKMKMKQGGCM
jgi:hypothetical protein